MRLSYQKHAFILCHCYPRWFFGTHGSWGRPCIWLVAKRMSWGSRKWNQHSQYLGDAGDSGLLGRRKRPWTNMTREKTSLLAPQTNPSLGGSEEKEIAREVGSACLEALTCSWEPVPGRRWCVCVWRKGSMSSRQGEGSGPDEVFLSGSSQCLNYGCWAWF